MASVLLAPQLVRGGDQANSVRVAAGTALLRLELLLESDSHPRYRPVLTTVAGDEVWSQRAIPATARAGEPVVAIELPATLLGDGDYILTLSGIGPDGTSEELAPYSFRIERP